MSNNHSSTRLTNTDLKAIEARVLSETSSIIKPSIESLQAQGYSESSRLHATIDWIAGAGYATTLFVGEFSQAFAAIGLMVLFILLEAERIHSGGVSLGLSSDKATLLALAFTSANVILPIYRLRNVSNESSLNDTLWTLRGIIEALCRRLVTKPTTIQRDIHHNSTLKLMEVSITFATLFLASYAVLGQQLSRLTDVVWYQAIGVLIAQSSIGEFLQLMAGLLVAIGGVFGVQTISHEIGVRTTDKPQRLSDVLQSQLAEYENKIAEIREKVTQEHIHGKISDEARRNQAKTEATATPFLAQVTGIPLNGNVNERNAHDTEKENAPV